MWLNFKQKNLFKNFKKAYLDITLRFKYPIWFRSFKNLNFKVGNTTDNENISEKS